MPNIINEFVVEPAVVTVDQPVTLTATLAMPLAELPSGLKFQFVGPGSATLDHEETSPRVVVATWSAVSGGGKNRVRKFRAGARDKKGTVEKETREVVVVPIADLVVDIKTN